MQKTLTLKELEKAFQQAKEGKFKFIGVRYSVEGYDESEISITPLKNFDKKLEYYKQKFDENGFHNYEHGVRLIEVDFEDFVDALEMFVED
jgi:hypothetical protein